MAAATGDPVANNAPAPRASAPAPVVEEDDEIPFKSNEETTQTAAAAPQSAAPAASGGAQDILAMIRARKGQ
jgi:hypothetical protein